MQPEFLKKKIVEDFTVYAKFSKLSGSWILSAQRLKNAADHLKKVIRAAEKRIEIVPILELADDLELFRPYCLLIGFAFENLLKAKLVRTRPDIISFDMKKDKINLEWKTHDLWDLANELKKSYYLELTPPEEEILCHLTLYVVWKGRYPTPKEKRSLSIRAGKCATFLNNYDLIDNLYEKIKDCLPKSL